MGTNQVLIDCFGWWRDLYVAALNFLLSPFPSKVPEWFYDLWSISILIVVAYAGTEIRRELRLYNGRLPPLALTKYALMVFFGGFLGFGILLGSGAIALALLHQLGIVRESRGLSAVKFSKSSIDFSFWDQLARDLVYEVFGILIVALVLFAFNAYTLAGP